MKLEGLFYEVPVKMVNKVSENNFDIGASPSEEEQETFDENVEKVFDVVHDFGLQQLDYDKKTFGMEIKDYMKGLVQVLEKEQDEESVAKFKDMAKTSFAKIVKNFDDYVIYTEDLERDIGKRLLIPMKYNEDGMSGTLFYTKDGLRCEKA